MPDRLSSIKKEGDADLEMDLQVTSVGIAVVSYNSREQLRACLASIEQEPGQEVVVVDSASSDGSIGMVRSDFPWVKLIACQVNKGYGSAANLAIANCSSKYVLLLNSDTELRSGALRTLSDYLDQHPEAAILGPRLEYPDGTDQPSCFAFPTPLQTLLRETRLRGFPHQFSKHSSGRFPDKQNHNARAVPWILGAALVIRRDPFVAVKGFDESFFMYFEEVDLCYRLKQAGWQTHFVPDAVIMHVGGVSTERHRAAMLQQLYKSLCHFYQQHYSRRQKFQLKLVLTYLMIRNIVKDKLRSFSPSGNDRATENLTVWRSILSSVWSANGWLKD